MIGYHGTAAVFKAFRGKDNEGKAAYTWFAKAPEDVIEYTTRNYDGDRPPVIYKAEFELGNCLDLTAIPDLAVRALKRNKDGKYSCTPDAIKLKNILVEKAGWTKESFLEFIKYVHEYEFLHYNEIQLFNIVKAPKFYAKTKQFDSVMAKEELVFGQAPKIMYGIRDAKKIKILTRTIGGKEKELVPVGATTKSLHEASDQAKAKLSKIDEFLDDIYNLRSTSLTTEGEFGIGNLTFKELRNRGILDHLKELKNEIESKDYSLANDAEQKPITNIDQAMPAISNPEVIKSTMPLGNAKNQLLSIAKNYNIEVNCNGKFIIKDLSVEEAKFLADKLAKAEFVDNVSQKESGKFDLRTVSPSRLPNRFIEISGELVK